MNRIRFEIIEASGVKSNYDAQSDRVENKRIISESILSGELLKVNSVSVMMTIDWLHPTLPMYTFLNAGFVKIMLQTTLYTMWNILCLRKFRQDQGKTNLYRP